MVTEAHARDIASRVAQYLCSEGFVAPMLRDEIASHVEFLILNDDVIMPDGHRLPDDRDLHTL